jgi:hypothetical protein
MRFASLILLGAIQPLHASRRIPVIALLSGVRGNNRPRIQLPKNKLVFCVLYMNYLKCETVFILI